jgi:hypothetical protein
MSSARQFTIVSGGQTGADRAALDTAIELCLPHDGWCPRGRLAEDGPIDEKYQLRETPSPRYPERTQWNARDTDATAIFTIAAVATGGSLLTITIAKELNKPFIHLSREGGTPIEETSRRLRAFLEQHRVERLNVAGSRASKEPQIGAFVRKVLSISLKDFKLVETP